MFEDLTDPPSKPIEVPASPVVPQLGVALRQILLAVLPFFVAGGYVQEEQGVAIISAIVLVATVVYGQWVSWQNQKKLRALANQVPDAVAFIK